MKAQNTDLTWWQTRKQEGFSMGKVPRNHCLLTITIRPQIDILFEYHMEIEWDHHGSAWESSGIIMDIHDPS